VSLTLLCAAVHSLVRKAGLLGGALAGLVAVSAVSSVLAARMLWRPWMVAIAAGSAAAAAALTGAVRGAVLSRRRAEESAKAVAALERRVARLSDSLRGLQREIDQSARLSAMGQTAAEIAHQLRNPLSSISLDLEMLEEELAERRSTTNDASQPLVGSIRSEVRDLVELTDSYLQFARVPHVKFARVDLSGLCHEVVALMTADLRERGIEARTRCDGNLSGYADRLQLRLALAGLVRNAIEAMPNGGRLSLSARMVDGAACVTVSDTGCGIPPGDLDEVFRPFFSTKDGGTGLGLAIAKRIIEEHGGTISCRSLPGTGTAVSFDLPCVEEKGAES